MTDVVVGPLRLQVFLARRGVASRRAAERLIEAGRVQVNGQTVLAAGTSVDPRHDVVTVDGEPIGVARRLVYYAVHKPPGVVSTARDPSGRPAVTDLVPGEERVYPVGRLDADSEGLVILTNDGDLALHLMHPRYEVEKEYHALVQGVPGEDALALLARGIILDGAPTAPARVSLLEIAGGRSWLSVEIREGRRRQVRRMLAAVGHQVRRLIRVRIGNVRLGNLPVGASRPLSRSEVVGLKAVGG